MRVVVTGHDGYIGAVLVQRLLDCGYDVTGIDTGYFRDCGQDPAHTARYIAYDIRDVTPYHFQDCSAVVNLAALSNDPLGALDERATDEINHQAAVKIASIARDAGITRFIQMSSCSIYGVSGDITVNETTHPEPITAYGLAKAAAESGIQALASREFSPVFLRCATAYGWSPRLRGDIIVNNLVGWAITTGQVRLLSTGQAWRPLVHVNDIALAILAMLEAPREQIHNRSFNIGSDANNYRVHEIAEIVASVIPNTNVVRAPGAEPDNRSYRVDFSLFRRTFPNHQPVECLHSSIAILADYIRARCRTPDDYFSPKHIRIDCIMELINAGRLDAQFRWVDSLARSA